MSPPCKSPLLQAVPLKRTHCEQLIPHLRPMDRLEVEAHGYTPRDALWWAMMEEKRSHAIVAQRGCIGAFGYTQPGVIWSLFAGLSNAEAFTITKNTVHWVRHMVQASGRPFLHNSVAVANIQAVKWLKASKAFFLDEREEYHFNGLSWHPFMTKPLADFPDHV